MQLHWSFVKPNVVLFSGPPQPDKALQWVLIYVKSSASSCNAEFVSQQKKASNYCTPVKAYIHMAAEALVLWDLGAQLSLADACLLFTSLCCVFIGLCHALWFHQERTCSWINILTLIMTFTTKIKGKW